MTAKEKALELVSKYQNGYKINGYNYNFCNDLEDSKQCALIAVDEIIKTEYEIVKKLLDIIASKNIRIVMSINEDYWQEVKKEIEKL